MKLLNRLSFAATATVLSLAALTLGLSGNAYAACFVYNQNGFSTSATPVFNNICGVPEGIGNESSFVRIRKDLNGDDTNNTVNPAYTVGTLTSSCKTGTKYDVWNYLHNNAYTQDNNNGTGSAVAHDVMSTMTAPINTTSTSFKFGDTVTANNALPVSDQVNLNCGSDKVTLKLVPNSIHIFSSPYGSNWLNLPNNTLNSPLKLGSPVMGSGDMWGCWNYRIVVVYQVTVASVTTTTTPKTPTTTTTPKTPTTPTKTTSTPTSSLPQPTRLVNTGPGTTSTVTAFALVTVAGAIIHRLYAIRRLKRS